MKTIKLIVDGKEIEAQVADDAFEITKKERWRAAHEDHYFHVDTDKSTIERAVEFGVEIDNRRYEAGNYFKTEEETEKKHKQLLAVLVPETYVEGEGFWYWGFGLDQPMHKDNNDLAYYAVDRKFATAEECQAWGDEFAEAFKK